MKTVSLTEQEDGTFKVEADLPALPLPIVQTLVDELHDKMAKNTFKKVTDEKIEQAAKTYIEPLVEQNKTLKLKLFLMWIVTIALILLIIFK